MRSINILNSLVRTLLLGVFLTWTLSATAGSSSSVANTYALVIGNAKYLGKGRKLTNPEADAALIAQSLEKVGFNVTKRANLSRGDLFKAVAEFADGLPEGATALIYYAGHGMQIGGSNFLIPVDMPVSSEQAVQISAYPLKNLLERMSTSKSAVNIVVLDACRNNPFQPETSIRLRSIAARGLAPVEAPRGTLVAYSTAPGQLAADGKNGNSLYATHLAQVMLDSQLSVEQIFKKVGQRVRKETSDQQIPWFESSLSDDLFFSSEGGSATANAQTRQASSK